MKICIAACDNKTEVTVDLCIQYCGALCRHEVFVTGGAAKEISEKAGFTAGMLLGVRRGGIEQISQLVCCHDADMVICLRDATPGHAEDPEVAGLIRNCDFHGVPVATGLATAKLLLSGLSRRNTAELFSRK